MVIFIASCNSQHFVWNVWSYCAIQNFSLQKVMYQKFWRTAFIFSRESNIEGASKPFKTPVWNYAVWVYNNAWSDKEVLVENNEDTSKPIFRSKWSFLVKACVIFVWSQFCQVCLPGAQNAYEFTSELDIELDFGGERRKPQISMKPGKILCWDSCVYAIYINM